LVRERQSIAAVPHHSLGEEAGADLATTSTTSSLKGALKKILVA
jgi:hypothetical protein